MISVVWLALATALAEDAGGTAPVGSGAPTAPEVEMPPPISDDEVDETIIVVSDPFSRWDGTRWFVKTEVGLPVPMTFFADENYEFNVNAFQVRTVLACEKDWKLSRKMWEVSCHLEDFAIQATDEDDLQTDYEKKVAEARRQRRIEKGKPELTLSREQRLARVDAILQEIDAKLTGAALQLQVTANGRVVDIDLEGVEKSDERTRTMHETLRIVLSRVIVGFDLKLGDAHFLETGIHTEYRSALMSLPIVLPDGSTVATMGNSMLVHRLGRIDGHLVVESRGKGTLEGMQNYWVTSFAGVGLYDEKTAYMTERVWVLKGQPTASSWIDMPYWHAGRIVQLEPDQHPNVGPSRQVTMPCCATPGIAPWTPLEE